MWRKFTDEVYNPGVNAFTRAEIEGAHNLTGQQAPDVNIKPQPLVPTQVAAPVAEIDATLIWLAPLVNPLTELVIVVKLVSRLDNDWVVVAFPNVNGTVTGSDIRTSPLIRIPFPECYRSMLDFVIVA